MKNQMFKLFVNGKALDKKYLFKDPVVFMGVHVTD